MTGQENTRRTARARRTGTNSSEVPEKAGPDLAAHIQQIVDAAPPLTPAQKARLATLLNPGAESLSPTTERRSCEATVSTSPRSGLARNAPEE